MKRVISLFLALILCLGLAVLPGFAADTYEVRYGEAAQSLWKDGLFLGNGASFALDQPLKRSEGITMVVRLLGKEDEAKAGSWTTPFTDLPAWAEPYVGYAYTNGLTKGTGATTFSPNRKMDARQFLTLVLRALKYDDKNGDFSYENAADKALEIGLIGEPCHEEYTTTDAFRRDNAAQISYMALGLNTNGTDTTLRSTITIPGQPGGSMPRLTDSQPETTESDTQPARPESSTTSDPVYRTCSSCGGSGKTTCVSCAGAGGKMVTSFRSDPFSGIMLPTSTWQPCSYCSGGRSICLSCHGTGRR